MLIMECRRSTLNTLLRSSNNNDASWLLGTIIEDVLVMIEGTDDAHKVWNSLEEMMLTVTKESKIHPKEALVSIEK